MGARGVAGGGGGGGGGAGGGSGARAAVDGGGAEREGKGEREVRGLASGYRASGAERGPTQSPGRRIHVDPLLLVYHRKKTSDMTALLRTEVPMPE